MTYAQSMKHRNSILQSVIATISKAGTSRSVTSLYSTREAQTNFICEAHSLLCSALRGANFQDSSLRPSSVIFASAHVLRLGGGVDFFLTLEKLHCAMGLVLITHIPSRVKKQLGSQTPFLLVTDFCNLRSSLRKYATHKVWLQHTAAQVLANVIRRTTMSSARRRSQTLR